MNTTLIGLISGLAFGILDVLLMIPINIPDKKTAMIGSFIGRFAIGFLIPNTTLPLPPWAIGLLIGTLLSLPDAVITKNYAPIIVIGAIGGLLIGFLYKRFI